MSEITRDSNNSTRRALIRKIACAAIMTALAVSLMYVEVSLPFMPPFLKFDFSEVPVLVGSFALGPIYGVIIELLKNLLHLPATGTMGIGELSNFITGEKNEKGRHHLHDRGNTFPGPHRLPFQLFHHTSALSERPSFPHGSYPWDVQL